MGFAGAEGDDGVGEGGEGDGGVGGVEEVGVEVVEAGAGGEERGVDGGEEGEGIEVASAEDNGVDVGFSVVVCETDGAFGGEELGDFGEEGFEGGGGLGVG